MQEFHVGGLEEAEGLELLRKQAIQGTEQELRTAVKRCNGHAFSLTLLALRLQRRNLTCATALNDPEYTQLWQGDIATNLLDSIYTEQLDQVQRKLLTAFSVYREPVSEALGIRKEVGARSGEGTTLNNLGSIYDDLGKTEEAHESHA